MHVVIVTNLPTPYRIPLFNALSKRLAARDWRLTVVFLVRGYARRKWDVNVKNLEFEHEFVKGRHAVVGEALVAFSPALFHSLRRLRPDAVIVGSMGFPALWTALYSILYSKPFVLWSGETRIQATRRKDYFGVRRNVRRFLVRLASAGLAYGSEARDFLSELGMSAERIDIAINTVDTNFFLTSVMNRPTHENVRFLYVGHFTRLKGLTALLEAYSKLNSGRVELHLVGEGEEEQRLREMVKTKNLCNVTFWGFRQKEELTYLYAQGDVFVFPSYYDVWGLVCVEAMACGLPVLGSRHAGCTRDIIQDGKNGFTIDPDNVEDMVDKMQFFLTYPHLLPEFQKMARETVVNKLSIDRCVEGFETSLRKIVRG
jgi:glycosyltransferase involved in cell wall biosynthesis